MWQCAKCHEQVEDSFALCWNCGTARDGTEDPDFRKADDVSISTAIGTAPGGGASPRPAAGSPEADPLSCPRCSRQLDYVGTKKFHEGTRAWDFLGGLWELFKSREHYDVYVCPRCGRVEFFVEGVGEQFRPH
jgi:hypothetical protein